MSPRASDELRAEWPGDGESGGDKQAITYLEQQGYRLRRDFGWTRPRPDHRPTERELSALNYLIDEWDYGGIEQ